METTSSSFPPKKEGYHNWEPRQSKFALFRTMYIFCCKKPGCLVKDQALPKEGKQLQVFTARDS